MLKKPTVFVGVPSASRVGDLYAGFSINSAGAGGYSITAMISHYSVLGANFNKLFCKAAARNADYFVMLHSDITPAGHGWVDTLIDSMREAGASVASQIMPWRGTSGLTSTGLDLVYHNYDNMIEFNDFSTKIRRVTMAEKQRLPKVVFERDLRDFWGLKDSGALLINTGMMAMDMWEMRDHRFPGFQCRDAVVWRKGVPEKLSASEDWEMSRWLCTNEIPYCAINNMPAVHGGDWSTQDVWGQEVDVLAIKSFPEYFKEPCSE